MDPKEHGLFATPEDANEFADHVAQRRPRVQTLAANKLREIVKSLDGLSAEVLFARAGRPRHLTRLNRSQDMARRGMVAADWALGHYRSGEGIQIRGLPLPVAPLVARVADAMRSPVDTFQWSVFALPANGRASDAGEDGDGDVFLFHVRGGLCTARTKRKVYELAPNSLVYVPPETKLVLEATEETLLLRVQIAFEPAWKVILYTLADRLAHDPAWNTPAVGLFGEGRSGVAARERMTDALTGIRAEIARWDVATVARDYQTITARIAAQTASATETASEGSIDGDPEADDGVPVPLDADSVSRMFPNAQWGIPGVTRRDDDIHVAPFKRSGTTWMQMILYQLLTDGDLDAIGHMYEFSPYPEYELRILGNTNRLDALPSPRVIKSHLPFDKIYSPRGKFIYVARNGMDVAVSSFHHHRGVGNGPIPFDVYIDDFLNEPRWFREVAGWWGKRDLPNVLFLTFRELKDDLAGGVAKVARFCGLDISPEKLATVVERSSFANMKRHESKFDHNLGVNWLMKQEGAGGAFIRNGKMSEGKTRLDEVQQRRFREVFQRFLGHVDLGLDE